MAIVTGNLVLIYFPWLYCTAIIDHLKMLFNLIIQRPPKYKCTPNYTRYSYKPCSTTQVKTAHLNTSNTTNSWLRHWIFRKRRSLTVTGKSLQYGNGYTDIFIMCVHLWNSGTGKFWYILLIGKRLLMLAITAKTHQRMQNMRQCIYIIYHDVINNSVNMVNYSVFMQSIAVITTCDNISYTRYLTPNQFI